MDYFLTTYAKDYKWPVVAKKKIDDTAEIEEAATLSRKKYIDMIDIDTKSKQTDTDVVPAQVGAPPQGPGSKFDQPSNYLRKLYTKYPYLYEIMKITPPAELAKKVYTEKYKTTYQEDFDSKGFMEFKSNVESLTQSIEKDLPPPGVCQEGGKDLKQKHKDKECACDHDTEHHPCTCAQDAHPVVKIAWKPAPISKMLRMPRDKDSNKKDLASKDKEKGSEKMPSYKPYRSEYKDSISRMGAIIIKKKLLHCEPPQYEVTEETATSPNPDNSEGK